jgi:hypothetical protein
MPGRNTRSYKKKQKKKPVADKKTTPKNKGKNEKGMTGGKSKLGANVRYHLGGKCNTGAKVR